MERKKEKKKEQKEKEKEMERRREVVRTAAQTGGAFGATMLGMIMMMPNLSFQTPGSAPSGGLGPGPGGSVPQVGSIGGGGLPTDPGISSLPLSLALVPSGLMPVAVFPPFARFVQFLTYTPARN